MKSLFLSAFTLNFICLSCPTRELVFGKDSLIFFISKNLIVSCMIQEDNFLKFKAQYQFKKPCLNVCTHFEILPSFVSVGTLISTSQKKSFNRQKQIVVCCYTVSMFHINNNTVCKSTFKWSIVDIKKLKWVLEIYPLMVSLSHLSLWLFIYLSGWLLSVRLLQK